MARTTLIVLAAIAVLLAALLGLAVWRPVTASAIVYPGIERFMLREPFRGVTTDGAPESGLFRIAPTGVDTARREGGTGIFRFARCRSARTLAVPGR